MKWLYGLTFLYGLGFVLVLVIELSVGPVTAGLAFLRALVWPLYVFFGIPGGQRLPMD